MSQQGARTFSTEFKQAVVLRLEAGAEPGQNVAAERAETIDSVVGLAANALLVPRRKSAGLFVGHPGWHR